MVVFALDRRSWGGLGERRMMGSEGLGVSMSPARSAWHRRTPYGELARPHVPVGTAWAAAGRPRRQGRSVGLGGWPPVELLLAPPQLVHQDRELAGERRARLLAAEALLQAQSPAPQGAGPLDLGEQA